MFQFMLHDAKLWSGAAPHKNLVVGKDSGSKPDIIYCTQTQLCSMVGHTGVP